MSNPNPRRSNLARGGKIGHKGAGGRPHDNFKAKMQALSNCPAAWKFRRDVIEGNPIEERMILDPKSGKEIKALVTTSVENRRRMLADVDNRGYGMSVQEIDISPLAELFDKMREKFT